MVKQLIPIILAGGQGTRLWPLSRAARPKQFLPLMGEASLFQRTLERVRDPALYVSPVIVTNCEYRFIVAEQAAEVGLAPAGILLEPIARNTALAIAAAARYAIRRFGNDVTLHVLPSDHEMEIGESYWQAISLAAQAADAGLLVTLGIAPTQPQTCFGYIKSGARIGGAAAPVDRFVEKPDLQTATAMLAEGGHWWNSGMFIFGAEVFLQECSRLAPDTSDAATAAIEDAREDLDFIRLSEPPFARAPDISVDYAVFERTDKAAVVAVDFAWSDLGSWDAVWRAVQPDAAGNVTQGAVTLEGVTRSLVVTDHAHVAVSGMQDTVVIATNDAVYVGPLSGAQSVGAMVRRLRAEPHTATLTEDHRTVYRRWGGYTSILDGNRFQVKRLFVKPGRQLSLQMHYHRAEHWVIVRGTAEVTLDGATSTLLENQSIYLPQGCVHRLANPGRIDLELIEVQTGSYLGEDDILRLEDDFGRPCSPV